MKDDLISRSALTDAIVDLLVFEWGYEGIEASVKRIFSEIPAVDAEKAFEQMGLVKEAFEMAKADLVAVVRCKDCVNWKKATVNKEGFLICPQSGMKIMARKYCSDGEKRADDGNEADN